jgi:energy-coupling factor transporter transmembrane protein EcfT
MNRALDPHPAVRLLALVTLGACLFQYGLGALTLVFGLLVGATALGGKPALEGLRRALKRIRWLLLSIVVIYLLVAPEPSVGDSMALPSLADLELALRRAGVLVVLVAAVELLRQTTPVPRTAAALAQILLPLSWLGVDTQRFSRRVALTLEAVPATAEVVGRAVGGVTIKKRQLAGWAEAAAGLISDIESEAPRGAGVASLPELGVPRASDWLLLAVVVAALYALTSL